MRVKSSRLESFRSMLQKWSTIEVDSIIENIISTTNINTTTATNTNVITTTNSTTEII